ncbi:MAG: arginine--tRNA ligase [Desulfobacterales bacterium]|nr:arginine--tRNA ligase [Desulfobacterales bacterium]MDD4073550.1 arginine--tRNA ligase [Desulfobacterales bacterium]MDD4392852.1 arginine--tRNA ligase [Desulfobacterales bacterium]
MKENIRQRIVDALKHAFESGDLSSSHIPPVEIEEPKIVTYGDFSTNIAMIMASAQKMSPRKIAEIICRHLNDLDQLPEPLIDRTDIAGPGFINFFIRPSAWYPVLRKVHEEGLRFGASDMGRGRKIQVEFVSANPTGPLHVGHGRGAAVGDSVANILSFCGYAVEKEYYINDSGRQINTLGRSVYLRYCELFGQAETFPEDCYQGDYIVDFAEAIKSEKAAELLALTPEAAIGYCARYAADNILAGIKDDLKTFGITFDCWFSEQKLFESGRVEAVLDEFQRRGIIYQKDGAQWFKTSDYGDEKDRVVVRGNGETTYFASDIAYHQDKYRRGFDRVIDVWGADHHGYIPRMAASVVASGYRQDQFDVILVHLVNLLRAGEPVAMSTRAGEFVTLKDVINEVGSDAARFIFLTRHYESPLDFDLELAKKKTNENPVYYVQYVHARISSIIRKGIENGIARIEWNDPAIAMLQEPEEIQLIKFLSRYPEIVEKSATLMEPHRITYYLMELAAAFHSYYSHHRVLTDTPELTLGRLYMIQAIKEVIRNGLTLLGVSAPEKM